MSNWTHVAGVIRIDSLRQESDSDFTEIFGKTLLYKDPKEVWLEHRQHPELFLPCGSEGSLEMSVWVNPDTSEIPAYTVTIFGDLRDHDSPDEIIEWFKSKCQQLWIRQAVVTVENEWNGTKTWVHEDDSGDEDE